MHTPYSYNESLEWSACSSNPLEFLDNPVVMQQHQEQISTSITCMREHLCTIFHAAQTLLMFPRQREEFECDLAELLSILDTAQMHTRGLFSSEIKVVNDFLENA